jgi:hypothetical protein
MVDLLPSPLHLGLEVDELPQIVRVDVLHCARSNLNFGDWYEDLISDDFNLGRRRLA